MGREFTIQSHRQLGLAFGYGRVAQAAYSAGGACKGHAALHAAWGAWERAKSMIAKQEGEELHFRLLALEGFLKGIEEKSKSS
jgi:hypothetical protein